MHVWRDKAHSAASEIAPVRQTCFWLRNVPFHDIESFCRIIFVELPDDDRLLLPHLVMCPMGAPFLD